MKKVIILFSFTLVITTTAFGQKMKSFQSKTEAETVIKFTPTKIFSGMIEFGVEQAIGDRTSVELNLGPTISNISPFGNGHGIVGDINGLYNTTGSQLGFHINGGIRFYPIEDKYVMNGFYVSPILDFRYFNYQFQDFYNPNGPAFDGFRQEMSFGFLFGAQSWVSKYFGLDTYMGMGIKSVDVKQAFNQYDPWGGTGVWQEQRTTDARWFVTAGIKIGIGVKKGE